jgi:hypothetical protein
MLNSCGLVGARHRRVSGKKTRRTGRPLLSYALTLTRWPFSVSLCALKCAVKCAVACAVACVRLCLRLRADAGGVAAAGAAGGRSH